MKTWREIRIEQTLKSYDPELFLNKDYKGRLQVMRNGKTYQSHNAGDFEIQVLTPSPHYIMSLTSDWSPKGEPVDWGLEPLLRRLQEIDDWGSESSFERMLAQNERKNQLKERAMKGLTEDVAKEWRKDFIKHTGDIICHSMDKTKDPRKKGDRKYGFGKSR